MADAGVAWRVAWEIRVPKLDRNIVIVVSLVTSIGNANFVKRLMVTVDWNGAIFAMAALLCGVRLVIIQILLLSRGALNINTRRFSVATVAFGNQVRRRMADNLFG